MTRPIARVARAAGAAALAGLVATLMFAVSRTSLADEMIDPPAKPARSAKASGAKPARSTTTAPIKAGKSRTGVAPPAVAQTPPTAPSPVPPGDTAPAPKSGDKPPVGDPRIEKLMEGARKAWESIGQPATGSPTTTPDQRATTATAAAAADVEELKATFRRPPEARTRPAADAVAALGARLFAEKKLSADHQLSCATCHDPARSFSDGRPRSIGRMPQSTRRNTPALWNVGFAKSFGWNGGASTLEAQVKLEIEREGGMDGTLEAAVVWLSRDATYIEAFDRTFRRTNALSTSTVAASLAAYLKSLASPPTRFDRWAEGDTQALDPSEIEGFRVFAGKGGCAACHSGWRFTDDAARTSAGRSVKTPGLREAVWSAPYMLDGRAKTLTAAVSHAAKTRGAGALTAAERAALVSFIKTLSSDQRPVPANPAR